MFVAAGAEADELVIVVPGGGGFEAEHVHTVLRQQVPEAVGRVGLHRFDALSVWYDHVGDTDGLKKALHETLTFYDHCTEVVPDSARWNLYFRTVPLLVRERKFTDAASLVSRALQTVAEGTHNWHAFMLQRAEIGFASEKPLIKF